MNKRAIVTGASSGIGKGIAVRLAEAGYDVAVWYSGNQDGAEDTVKQVRELGREALLVRADLRDLDQIRAAFDTIGKVFETYELLVNNAGITKWAPVVDTTPELFDSVLGVDFRGAFFCTQFAARAMIAAKVKGLIVNISSNHSAMNWKGFSVYAATKCAMNKLTQIAALELAEHGIRVVGIAPGYTMIRPTRPETEARIAQEIPIGRWARPDEVGELVVNLASHKMASLTGTTIVLDGGASLKNK